MAWNRLVAAGSLYCAMTFAVGFMLGVLRVLFVAPRLGATAAVTLEAPVMLLVSWHLSRWCCRRLAVPGRLDARIAMGAVAFLVLVALEIGFSTWVFRQSLGLFLRGYGTLAGDIGLGTQLAFAAFPSLQRRQG